jgi:hypothetical protein
VRYCVVIVTVTVVMLRERSEATYVSLPTTKVEPTMNEAQPPLAACGLALTSAVAPKPTANCRLIESVALVTVLKATSLTQTETADWDAPFAGIGLGDAVAANLAAAPKPVNEMVAAPGTSGPDVAVAVHASARASLIVNVTVESVADVAAVAGFPAPPAGTVLTTVAEQKAVVPV